MTNTIYNIALLKERTAAAALSPKQDLPMVGTVISYGGSTIIVTGKCGTVWNGVRADGLTYSGRETFDRYATPDEIDQFAKGSALPEIVDPVEAMIDDLLEGHNLPNWPTSRDLVRAAILAGRARAAEVGS